MYAYQTPTVDGVYYLFNTGVTDGSSGFISRGENYAKRAVIDKYGIPLKLVSTGTDDTYYFQFYDTGLWLSDNGYMYTDGGTDRRRAIKVVSQGDGNYKLINTNNDNTEVENWYGYPVGDGTGNRRDYLWQFLSAAEYEAKVADYTATERTTIASTMGWNLSGTDFFSYLSANYVGIDKTSLIQNATFDSEHSTGGWTVTANANSSMSIGWGNESVEKITPEVYQGYGTISQTVTVPSAGLYKVSVNAFVRNQNYVLFHNEGIVSSISYLKANDNKVRLCDIYSNGEVTSNFPGGPNAANNNFFSQGKYLNEVYVYVTDASKQITITLGNPSHTDGCWMVFNNFKLTYYSDAVSEEDASSIVGEATALETETMQATILSALSSAKTAFNEARTIANYNTLTTAIANATASKNAYANAKAYLDEAATILEGTNVYTSTAYATYYTEPKTKYEARTLTTEEANALVKTSTGWHSVNTIDDILLSAWTIGGEQSKDYEKKLYINTWSVEGNTDGSNFFAPFFEYWVQDTDSLGANTLVSTVTGLKANTTYSFTIRARVRQTNGKTKNVNGITMKVGEGEAVDISSGAQFNNGQFYIGNFSAVGQTDAYGNLVTTITVAENNNISWLSFYNAKYTEGEDLSAYIADYEFALNTATANSTATAYANVTGKEKYDLTTALTTYASASVDQTSKTALIAAKEALESANATFVAAAPAYNTYVELNSTIATKLGVTWPEITNSTVASDLKVEQKIVDLYTAAAAYSIDVTSKLGTWNNAPGTNKGESWNNTPDDTYYDLYNNSAVKEMTQTVTLAAGDYVLIAKGRASVDGRLTLSDGTNTVTFPHKSSEGYGIDVTGNATFDASADYARDNKKGYGWEYRVLTFTSDGETPITLTFNWITANSNWCGLDDIVLKANLVALDYSALQTAYNAVTIPTLGFEESEYAPYTNAENLKNIEKAKILLDNNDALSQNQINTLTTAINSMTWTANTARMNAIGYGDFATYETIAGKDYPYGWNLSIDPSAPSNLSRIMGGSEGTNNNGLSASTSGKALLIKFNATYGDTEGYTMPLKANTVYKLSFKYCGWGDDALVATNVVMTAPDNSEITLAPGFTPTAKNGENDASLWSEYTGYFVTTTAGNYKLNLNKAVTGQHQIAIADIDLQVGPQYLTFTDGAVPTYAPGIYPSVRVSRTFKANKWATAVYPFAITAAVGGIDEIATLDSFSDEGTLGFSTTGGVSTANEPFMMRTDVDGEQTFSWGGTGSEVQVYAAVETPTVTKGSAKLIGAYAATPITNAEKNYVLSNNTIYPVGAAGATIPAYRAYIQIAQTGSAARSLKFVIDGEETTGIDGIATESVSRGEVYNLNGQRVASPRKGLYIQNGKKVLVK